VEQFTFFDRRGVPEEDERLVPSCCLFSNAVASSWVISRGFISGVSPDFLLEASLSFEGSRNHSASISKDENL
jgi:hypothetical protein